MDTIFSISRRSDASVVLPQIADQLSGGTLRGVSWNHAILVLWTKDPGSVIDHLPALKGWRFYVQATATGYGPDLEPGTPLTNIDDFLQLSREIGADRIIWRYDPIIFTPQMTARWHLSNFERIADRLYTSTNRCVISVMDVYHKAKVPGLIPWNGQESAAIRGMVSGMLSVANTLGFEIESCSESGLDRFGVNPGCCIDAELIKKLWPVDVASGKDPSQRRDCGCAPSRDLGSYGTCKRGCVYCYAK